MKPARKITADGLHEAHRRAFGRDPTLHVRAPGRASLLGGHADYNEGFVLPVALDLYTHATLSAGDSSTGIRVHSQNAGEGCSFRPGEEPASLPDWAHYLRGVVEELHELGHDTPPIDLLVYGEVPIGSGLSSSASLTVAAATALSHHAGLDLSPHDLVRLCRRAEERHAGVGCGIMDPFISYLGRRDHALLIDCRTLEFEEVPLPAELDLLILDTRVRRRLAASDFGVRRQECDQAVREIREILGEPIQTLRDVSADRLLGIIDRLSPPTRLRSAHVVADMARAVRGADALRTGDLAVFGEAMFETHASLRDLYQVSIPELDCLVEIARSTDGVVGARLTGAGFGGCVVCLVHRGASAGLHARLRRRYSARFGEPPDILAHRVSDGARLLN